MSSSLAPNALSMHTNTGDEHQKFQPSSAKPAPLNTQLKNTSITQLSSSSSTSPLRSLDDYSSPEFHFCASHSTSTACIELHSPSAHSLPRSVSSRSPSPEHRYPSHPMLHDTMTETETHDVAAERPPRFGFHKSISSSTPEFVSVEDPIPDAYHPRGRSDKPRPLPPAPRDKADPYDLVPNYPFGERLSAALGVTLEELGEDPDEKVLESVSELKMAENELTVTEFPMESRPTNPFRVATNIPLPPSQDPSRMSSPVAPNHMVASAVSHMSAVETMSMMSDGSHSSIGTPASSTTHMMRSDSPATTVGSNAGDPVARLSKGSLTRVPVDLFPPPPGSLPPAPPSRMSDSMAQMSSPPAAMINAMAPAMMDAMMSPHAMVEDMTPAPAAMMDAMMAAPVAKMDAMMPAPAMMAEAMMSTSTSPPMADAMAPTPAAMNEVMMSTSATMHNAMAPSPAMHDASAMMSTSMTMHDSMMPTSTMMSTSTAMHDSMVPASAMNDAMAPAPAMMTETAMSSSAAMTRPSSSAMLTEAESANLEPVPEYMRHPDQSQGEETVDQGPRRPFQVVRQALRPRRAGESNMSEPPPYATPPENASVGASSSMDAPSSSSSFSLRNLFTRSASVRERSSSPKARKLHKRAKSNASTLSNTVEMDASGEMPEGAMMAMASEAGTPATAMVMMAETPAGMAGAPPSAMAMMDAPATAVMTSSPAMAGTPRMSPSMPASARSNATARPVVMEYGVVVGSAGTTPASESAAPTSAHMATPTAAMAASTPVSGMSGASAATIEASMEAMSMESDAAMMPTMTPTPGHPLLHEGEILVYPGGEACPICQNTGYHTHKFDPLHPCKGCWAKFSKPFNSLGAKLVKNLSKKGRLQKPLSASVIAMLPGVTEGAAMTADTATMSDTSTMADGAMSTMVSGASTAGDGAMPPASAMMAEVAPMMVEVAPMMADAAPAMMMTDVTPITMMADAAPTMMMTQVASTMMMTDVAPTTTMTDSAPAMMMADATPATMHNAAMTPSAMTEAPVPAPMQDAPASMMTHDGMPPMWKEHMSAPIAPNGMEQQHMAMMDSASHIADEHSHMVVQSPAEHAMTEEGLMSKRKPVPAMTEEHMQPTPSPAPAPMITTAPPAPTPVPVFRPAPSAPPAWLPRRST